MCLQNVDVSVGRVSISGHSFGDPPAKHLLVDLAIHDRKRDRLVFRQSKKLVVKVPAGIREGQRIRLAGMGEKGKAGGKPGDLFLKVHIRKPLLKSIKDFFVGRKASS